MSDERIRRRGWVKNAAIVFLAVMLVLTLFSNTIMNRSLPEVATQYVSSGTITAKIRGSGTVTANESYEVKISQSRTVHSVAVKAGSAVEAGDVLFVLADKDSTELETAKKSLAELNASLQRSLISATAADYSRENKGISRAQEDLQNAKNQRDANIVTDEELAEAQNAVAAAQEQVTAVEKLIRDIEFEIAESSLIAGITETDDPDETDNPDGTDDPNETDNLSQRLFEAQERLIEVNAELTNATLLVQELEAKRQAWETGNETVKQMQRSLEDLLISLAEVQKQNGVTSALESLDIKNLRAQITAAEAEVKRLQDDAVGSELTSPVSGIVRSVTVTAGNTTDMNQVLAVIEVVDRGYSVSFPVSVEKSKRVKVGDMAETSGYYWGPSITARLSSIKNDPDNPTQSRLLTFDIMGEVESGAQLSLSIGERSQDFEYIVPNSALREDANGSFVLIVMAKNTAFVNRYIATRIDVTVLAKDDTNTAISGGISSWDYVITSATKPIEPGMQVRLVEG